ncbi:hypothetical protein ABZY19_28945 [Streptomyces sp. NPDC006475]|uniref:hypothetical protein n=1 Tax=Streptomyces sp. NPDC006475 TaxID=3155719 RepID=UPI0033ABA655
MGDLEIGIAEGTTAWLQVNTAAGNMPNALKNTTRPEEAEETVVARDRTSYGDITLRRS